jgi:hypothetical protein
MLHPSYGPRSNHLSNIWWGFSWIVGLIDNFTISLYLCIISTGRGYDYSKFACFNVQFPHQRHVWSYQDKLEFSYKRIGTFTVCLQTKFHMPCSKSKFKNRQAYTSAHIHLWGFRAVGILIYIFTKKNAFNNILYLNVLRPVVFNIVSRGTDTQRLWYSQYCGITVSNFITFTTCFGSQNHHQVTPFTKFHPNFQMPRYKV